MKLHLFKSYCLPSLFYGCEAWSLSTSDQWCSRPTRVRHCTTEILYKFATLKGNCKSHLRKNLFCWLYYSSVALAYPIRCGLYMSSIYEEWRGSACTVRCVIDGLSCSLYWSPFSVYSSGLPSHCRSISSGGGGGAVILIWTPMLLWSRGRFFAHSAVLRRRHKTCSFIFIYSVRVSS